MVRSFTKTILVLVFAALWSADALAQEHSVAMKWNEVQLNCIRKDRARPTVQARNLAHAAIVMWDAWSAYDDNSKPYFLGNTWGGFECPFEGIPVPDDIEAAREKAISYAMYRFLYHRYLTAPVIVPNTTGQQAQVAGYINGLMTELGYDPAITSTDYTDGDPAKLGNYIAMKMQEYALQDGANQGGGAAGYANQYYTPLNAEPLNPNFPGNPDMVDPNRWQGLCLEVSCEQGTSIEQGNCVPVAAPCNSPALTPEFGHVNPFALTENEKIIIQRDGHDWPVYLDQGAPPLLDQSSYDGLESFFKWGYVTNIIWHSFHDPADGVWVDISPNAVGNIQWYPESGNFEQYQNFYNVLNGTDASIGHAVNPATGFPYEQQWVKRGDFTRVLSEFWADGPASETPPGHWFTILNEKVTLHPQFERRWMGTGEILDPLEWDVRAYLALGGGVMDAAIACWGAKGAYDYGRPIHVIRYMAERGQCTDPMQPNYHPEGLPLIPGYIEIVQPGDPLAGLNNEHVGKIKVYSWTGPPAATGYSGVDWLLGENWWTYQSAGFVTPPFPGYMSGHSTYSRTAAEILTAITGDEFFPGGFAEFYAPAYDHLVAEAGPSMDIHLQWATYRDASDQCSMSRIFGGLHPPQDDIPGRRIGMVLGPMVVDKAEQFINADMPHVDSFVTTAELVNDEMAGSQFVLDIHFNHPMNTGVSPIVSFINDDASSTLTLAGAMWVDADSYMVTYNVADVNETLSNVVWKVSGAIGQNGQTMLPALSHVIVVDTENPTVADAVAEMGDVLSDVDVNDLGSAEVVITFSEDMNTSIKPEFDFPVEDPSNSLSYDMAASYWENPTTFVAIVDLFDVNEVLADVDVNIISGVDASGNAQIIAEIANAFSIETDNPEVAEVTVSDALIADNDAGQTLTVSISYDEDMDTAVDPAITFSGDLSGSLTWSSGSWSSTTVFEAIYTLSDNNTDVQDVTVSTQGARDANGNAVAAYTSPALFSVDNLNPLIDNIDISTPVVTDSDAGASFVLTLYFNDAMNGDVPVIDITGGNVATTLEFNETESIWIDGSTFEAHYNVSDVNVELSALNVVLTECIDDAGNDQTAPFELENAFSIDTQNPSILAFAANTYNVTSADMGANNFTLTVLFDEPMDAGAEPMISFPVENPLSTLTYNGVTSDWVDGSDLTAYQFNFNVGVNVAQLLDIDVMLSDARDAAGNLVADVTFEDFFDINAVVSVEEWNGEAAVLYPNPVVSGQVLTVMLPGETRVSDMRVFNALGAVIDVNQSFVAGEGRITLQTSGLAAGLYIMTLEGNSGRQSLQFQVID